MIERLGTSRFALAPEYVTVNPVFSVPLTVTVPANPAMALIAAWMPASVYSTPPFPISADFLPPISTRNDDFRTGSKPLV